MKNKKENHIKQKPIAKKSRKEKVLSFFDWFMLFFISAAALSGIILGVVALASKK